MDSSETGAGKPRGWPEITSPLARQVVAAAWELTGDFPARSGAEYLADKLPHSLFVYRDGLRQRLAGSGIAQRLIAGQEAFPDIYERLPWPWKSVARHILENLEWYLDPSQAPWSKWIELVQPLGIMQVMGTVLALSGFATSAPYSTYLFFAGLALFVPALFIGQWRQETRTESSAAAQRRRVRRAEFYYYLRESYRDTAQQTLPDSLLPSGELLEEIEEQRQSACKD